MTTDPKEPRSRRKPPLKKRRLMPFSVTDESRTPSPSTPESKFKRAPKVSSMPEVRKTIPKVNSTPIRNYFARFTDAPPAAQSAPRPLVTRLISSGTPRTLWRKSDKIVAYPSLTELSQRPNQFVSIDYTKYDGMYHPLVNTISKRIDLNVFSEAYSKQSKRYYDEHPFLDPRLQLLMRDDAFQFMCNHDSSSSSSPSNKQASSDHAANHLLDAYGDVAINKMSSCLTTDQTKFQTSLDRAKLVINHLNNAQASQSSSSSSSQEARSPSKYDDLKEGMVFLSGVLEFIVTSLVDASALAAQSNGSCHELNNDRTKDRIREYMTANPKMVCPYDEDVYKRDVDRHGLIIRPMHIRQAIAQDDQLFYLQQAIQLPRVGGDLNIRDALPKDCVYHICSFFAGDLPMLSSLARVDRTFYAMTACNKLWRPIAERCFLLCGSMVDTIQNVCNTTQTSETSKCAVDEWCDFRNYIGFGSQIKHQVCRERWIKQDVDALCDLFVRINPVYDVHTTLYRLLYADAAHRNTQFNGEMYDLIRHLLELFGVPDFHFTMEQIVNNARCLDFKQTANRLRQMFGGAECGTVKRVLQMEFEDRGSHDRDVLFVELPMSASCFEEKNRNRIVRSGQRHTDFDNMNEPKHFLWIGRNFVMFAEL